MVTARARPDSFETSTSQTKTVLIEKKLIRISTMIYYAIPTGGRAAPPRHRLPAGGLHQPRRLAALAVAAVVV
eukprot:11342792-Heterocapsa_arctica.AAC.1